MSSKYHVFTPWQEFDKDSTAHVIKAATPFSAAMAFAIREWGLYHLAEKVYEVYDSRGILQGRFNIPDWVDDSFGEAIKEAFHIEVVVERNEHNGAADAQGNTCCVAGTSTQQPTGAVAPASLDDYVEGLALTADRLEFAACKDGSVVLQGVGYFEFYGGLDDEAAPLVCKDLVSKHYLLPLKGNTFSTIYGSVAEAIAALKADGFTHCPGLQAFLDA